MFRFRIVVLSLVTVISVGATASAQSMARRGSQLLSEAMLNHYGLTRAWWSHATINSKRDKLMHMVVDETHLFLQSSSGIVSAFHTETGRYLWTKQVGGADQAMYPATSNDELLFVINGMKLFALNKNTGNTVWFLTMPGMAGTSPTADDRRVYVGLMDGSLYAFDLLMIQKLFSEGKLPQFSEATVLWRYRTSKSVSIPAVPADNLVAFASRNGSLYSVTKEDRKLLFQFETDAPLTAPIVRYKDSLLLASEDFNFYSLDIRTGKPGWQFTAGTVIRKAPVLIGDEVYLFPDYGNMYKLSAVTGHPFWSVPRMVDFLSASTNRVYVVDKHNNFTILTRDSGEPLGSFPLNQFTKHLANDRSDRIYVATEAGLVICLHEQRREFARFHKHPDREPILPEFAPEGTGEDAGEMNGPGDKSAGDADMPADGEKPEADKPEADKPESDKPDADQPEGEKPEDEKPAS
ncbi:MAG: PQQ-binding-like beta-propeller repeat protein [Deltaproteobacteria bacterium]